MFPRSTSPWWESTLPILVLAEVLGLERWLPELRKGFFQSIAQSSYHIEDAQA